MLKRAVASLTAGLALTLAFSAIGVSASPAANEPDPMIPTEDWILYNPFLNTLDAIEPILVENSDIYARRRLDWESTKIVISLVDGPSTISVQAELEAAAGAVGDNIDLEFKSAPVSRAELVRSAQEIFDTRSEWSPNPSHVYYVIPRAETATIQIGIGEANAESIQSFASRTASGETFDVIYSLEPGPPEIEAGSRHADQGNWTGGNWLGTNNTTIPNINNSHCGLGFTWRRWAGSVLRGGTAEHCINPRDLGNACLWRGFSFPDLFHNQRHLGTAERTSPNSDSALLAPAPNTAFSPTVWVGAAATAVERSVVAASALDEIDDVVALSGARNGLPGTVTDVVDVDVITCAGLKTATTDYVSEVGDSGSPWLTTYSNGTVRAHGQHSGRVFVGGIARSMYTPVTRTSVALEASIAVAP